MIIETSWESSWKLINDLWALVRGTPTFPCLIHHQPAPYMMAIVILCLFFIPSPSFIFHCNFLSVLPPLTFQRISMKEITLKKSSSGFSVCVSHMPWSFMAGLGLWGSPSHLSQVPPRMGWGEGAFQSFKWGRVGREEWVSHSKWSNIKSGARLIITHGEGTS